MHSTTQMLRAGGVAAIVCALTYVFGFVLFFGLIEPPQDDTDIGRLNFLLSQRDTFFVGYIVIGIVFSLSLLLLNQSLKEQYQRLSPGVAHYNSILGNIWATFVLASTFIFLVSLSDIAQYADTNQEGAVNVLNAIDIVVDALGGGIELLGALWVLLISVLGMRYQRYFNITHILGIVVGIAGILTLFSGLSFLTNNSIFQASTALFGLGQILWFILVGINLLKSGNSRNG